MLRVLLADSALIFWRSSFLGGVSSRSLPLHLALTPKLSKTSMMRKTSSMRGMPRRVVLPWFKSEAERRATAEFLEVLVEMVPESL